jgi:glycosyltransferase involved in cell wall biosynthesis
MPLFKKLCEFSPNCFNYNFFACNFSKNNIKIYSKMYFHEDFEFIGANKFYFFDTYNIFGNKSYLKSLFIHSYSKQYNCIILLGNANYPSLWLAAILARITGKTVLMWTHGFLRNENCIKGFVRLAFYRLAHGLLLYGHRAREILANKGYPDGRMEVIYNSLDYDKQRFVRKSLTDVYLSNLKTNLFSNSSLPVIIFIGRLTPQKKLHQLLQATHILAQRSCPINVLFVGSGQEKPKLNALVTQFNLSEYVIFYGETYDENEIGGLISISDICVSPGEVGLTCMHSMAYGTPVITHDDFDFQMPEVEAIQPGLTGGFFKRDDPISLADSIYNYLHSRSSSDSVRDACVKIIESKYNSSVQLKLINNFIKKIEMMQ